MVAKAEEAKAEARAAAVGMVGDAATLVATLVATEAMVAERTGLVVEEGTVQQAVTEVMAVAAVALEAVRVEAEAAEAIVAAAAMAAGMVATEAMTVGTAAWLSSFFFKRACSKRKGHQSSRPTRAPATKSRQNFATVSEFRRGMVIELL